MLAINTPPWFTEPPNGFGRETRELVYRWFEQYSSSIGALIVGVSLHNDHPTNATLKEGIVLGLEFLAGNKKKTSLISFRKKIRWRPGDPPTSGNYCRNIVFQYADSILASSGATSYGRLYWRLVQATFAGRISNQERRNHNANTVPAIALEDWATASHRRVIFALQRIFHPPSAFQPTTPAEWLIAADMLEEAGEIRAEAIRAAVKGESDEKIFAAIYKALPPDLLA